MPRRRVVAKRQVLPDPRYGSELLAKFINVVMVSGKKSVAEKIVYGALEQLNQSNDQNKLDTFGKALDNVRPVVEVKSRRVGGATYQVPIEVSAARQSTLAMRWLVDASRKRSEKTMGLRLGAEILEAADKRGSAVKKKEDTHRMADANKAFAHYRW